MSFIENIQLGETTVGDFRLSLLEILMTLQNYENSHIIELDTEHISDQTESKNYFCIVYEK